tara:strand:- start:10259 stop:11356 length:1098 start_codon:yes stop_codon:yes gene_type:complete
MKISNKILFSRLVKNNKLLKKDIIENLAKDSFIFGKNLSLFENNLTRFLNISYAAGVANGTDAIYLSLISAGLKAGDKVGLTSSAAYYSSLALNRIGAIPIYFDISLSNYQLSLDELEKLKSGNVKFLILTHLFGYLSNDIFQIVEFCKKNNIIIIEDCAQSFGSKYKNKYAGTFGNVSAFSFYPTKNLGGIGDGGAVVTNEKKIHDKIIMLRQYGWGKKYYIDIENGINSRMDTIQAIYLNKKLKKFKKIQRYKLKNFSLLNKLITNQRIIKPVIPRDGSFSCHQFVVKIYQNRNSFINHLSENGIESNILYPILDYQQKVSKVAGKLKNSEILKKSVLALPINSESKENEIKYISNIINKWKI